MKISSVEAIELAGTGEQGAYGRPSGVLVRVEADSGLVGWGESDSLPAAVRAIVEAPFHNEMLSGLAAVLVGSDPLDIGGARARMARSSIGYARDGATLQAMAAIDIALWDLKGKALRRPVHELLGGARRKTLECYATHPLGATPGETAAHVRKLVDLGHRAVKLGWHPLGPDAERDEAIVRTLRAAIGPDVKLMIDGGLAWTVEEALKRCRRFAQYDLTWLEEPLAPYDLAGYRRLAEEGGIPIAAGEMASSRLELERLAREGRVAVLQVDVSRVGLSEAIEVAQTAAALGIPCINHTYSYDLNLAASLHWMAAIESVSLCEVQATPNEIRDRLTRKRLLPQDGRIAVPEGPGLGVDIDEEAVARFRV